MLADEEAAAVFALTEVRAAAASEEAEAAPAAASDSGSRRRSANKAIADAPLGTGGVAVPVEAAGANLEALAVASATRISATLDTGRRVHVEGGGSAVDLTDTRSTDELIKHLACVTKTFDDDHLSEKIYGSTKDSMWCKFPPVYLVRSKLAPCLNHTSHAYLCACVAADTDE